MSSKYQRLAKHLKDRDQDMIRMTFQEVESIIDGQLPPAARDHRAWWSNSMTHSHARYGWMGAGYETAKVDMEAGELVFLRSVEPRPALHEAHMLPPPQPSPALRGRTLSDTRVHELIRSAGGLENLVHITRAIQQYIDGDLLETELGRILRKLWPRH